jgi:hypothetical protein
MVRNLTQEACNGSAARGPIFLNPEDAAEKQHALNAGAVDRREFMCRRHVFNAMQLALGSSPSKPAVATAALCVLGHCLLLSGCMTVRIEARDTEVKVVRHVGLLIVDTLRSNKSVVGDIRGVGIVSTPLGWTAGYTRQRWAAIGPQCRAVLWVDGSAPLDEASRRMLIDVAGLCLVDASAEYFDKKVTP